MTAYIALIHKDAGSDYGVSFPDFPGCVTAGVDLDDARRMAEEALALHIEGLAESGEAIPEPSPLDAVMVDPQNRDGVAVLIPAPAAETKIVRVNVTFDERVLRRIDAYTEAHGFTRSGLLARAATRAIEDGSLA
jgi:predicted RNase H-like HicB family nuclease